VLADDSGLCLPVLDGRPGVYSARFGDDLPAPPQNDAERNAYLLSLIPRDSRPEAFFVCAMVLLVSEYRFFAAQETVSGVITHQPRGSGGFGYDPVFYLPARGLTVAEIELKEKNTFSHRGRAVGRIRAILESE
jgi:XTP/dITP diphosphohydrolase